MFSPRRWFLPFLTTVIVPVSICGTWLLARHQSGYGALAFLMIPATLLSAAMAAVIYAKSKTQQEIILQEKNKLENLFLNLPDGIIKTNLRGEVDYVNTPAMLALGLRKEDVVQSGQGLFEPLRRDRLRPLVQEILDKHSRSEIVELSLPGADAPIVRCYKTAMTVFPEPDRADAGIILMLRDVTAERRMTQMKDDFFHSVAHDLRAPLFAIQGYLRLLQKHLQKDARSEHYFGAIYQSCGKLTLFIQDILDTHRLEAGRLAPNITEFEPLELLQRIKTLYDPVAHEKGIKLEADLPQDYPGSLEGDERLMERVFNNLVSNALKFTPRDGTVRIAMTSAGPDQMQFTVSDTGPGIPKDKQDGLFEKFSQLDTGQQRTGFGLGLNICRRVVELHHGKIWVESETGKGSEFIFRIPRKQPRAS